MKILGSVCARGGSKGVKNKNIRLLKGSPLISYSIKALLAWGKADRVVVSTDSMEIQEIARDAGAEIPFTRPEELSTDRAGKLEVFQHLVKFCEKQDDVKYDYLVDLDASSPLRTIQDIENCFEMIVNSDVDLVTSAYKAERNPYFNMMELDEKGYAKLSKKTNQVFVARQSAPIVYSLNASIWIYKRDFLLNATYSLSGKTLIYEMPDYSIDIDREIDFDFIEFILDRGRFKFDY